MKSFKKITLLCIAFFENFAYKMQNGYRPKIFLFIFISRFKRRNNSRNYQKRWEYTTRKREIYQFISNTTNDTRN